MLMKELPNDIQQQIKAYLQTDNFRAAKELRDRFVLLNREPISARTRPCWLDGKESRIHAHAAESDSA